jgi:hypothetical protein
MKQKNGELSTALDNVQQGTAATMGIVQCAVF